MTRGTAVTVNVARRVDVANAIDTRNIALERKLIRRNSTLISLVLLFKSSFCRRNWLKTT